MTDVMDDGGADSWTSGGAAALATYAPEVLTSYGVMVSVRPLGVHDEMLEAPDVVAFAEQFGVDAAGIEAPVRDRFARATGDQAVAVANMVWIGDVASRIRSALDALFGPSDEWPGRRRYPVSDTRVAISAFTESVALLDRLDTDRPDTGQAALALTDAISRTPTAIPASTVQAVHELLSPAQAVAVVLRAASGSADRVDVALR